MKIDNQKGFTLIEVIILLIIAGIMGSYLVVFVQTTSRNSVKPILLINERTELQEEMENMTQDYKNQLKAGNFSLTAFKTNFVDGNSLVVASETKTISFNAGEEGLLLVTLQSGDLKLWSLFSE